ncbi:AFL216Cp [Eremothecium gossypii ATCC 10895]|uniref:AFL216Cp n=1 Tax=Eremothecium gossypii (strain ATCC 10895 / CBS 109.51 / FGSC 9923 / NRRL Y-1056) TaxID=284811 RepID=Q755N0_EREGS|nr:AFL216Cp [Eremothecium gossypii ATCC 10895]AAS53158.1 AFL216Cp [Eremothecium gossypii ATCC 10895]AEY97468.1 FAFL216Cp [Eremothecium gossypii FDAG1]AGO14265.1 AaceriAFL216Cp [[Ashbya] aceris (nom. inval.)]
MINFFRQIRNVFKESHAPLQQILLSRRAFFRLLGYLGTCTLLIVVAQNC